MDSMNKNEIPQVRTEVRTDIGTIFFQGSEFDCLSHFYPKEDWFRVRDRWGRVGWCVGYRDWIRAQCQPHRPKPGIEPLGHGGQIWVLYDHDNSIGGISPVMAEII